jgi:nitrate reductase gamma subunit
MTAVEFVATTFGVIVAALLVIAVVLIVGRRAWRSAVRRRRIYAEISDRAQHVRARNVQSALLHTEQP